MNLNTYEYVLMWAEGCSTMAKGHPALVFENIEFEQANSLAHKFKYLEKEGYILCTWTEFDQNSSRLRYCSITPKGIEYYESIKNKKPLGVLRSNFSNLVYVTLAALCGSIVTLLSKS